MVTRAGEGTPITEAWVLGETGCGSSFGPEGSLSCHMWCFVVIPEMEGHRVSHGQVNLEAGVYAVVECATEVQKEQDDDARDIIVPISKEVLYDEK